MLLFRFAVLLTALLLPAIATAADEILETETGPIRVETFASGLNHPWGLAFLPDGGMLVTERSGTLRFVSDAGELSDPISGVPEVVARGQGGLLDVALHPGFAENRLVYLTFSEAGDGNANGTAIARGVLSEDMTALDGLEVVFRQQPKVASNAHFGSRIVFDNDGLLWATLGERSAAEFRVMAQDLNAHLGKVIRIHDGGSVPADNPFVGVDGALPEIWSYGHRNPQGMALHPETGVVWTHEHGPRGGDEVQIPKAGANHGWPVFSYGTEYSGVPITTADDYPDEFARPVHQWTPSIAPSGMAFYMGDLIPAWKGNLLVGALAGQRLVRLELDGESVVGEEHLLQGLGKRIRDVRNGPDGAVWLLTDEPNGEILRVVGAAAATD
ncbi:MAG: PQQ-dependent sugar dehydrogenase [Dongiaceae bacterium]